MNANTGNTWSTTQLDRTDRWLMVGCFALTFVLLHVALVAIVHWYYSTHLPHYDSIGSYTTMARVARTTRLEGFEAGFTAASLGYLSWLQTMFAAATAWLIPSSPAGMQLLNTLCLTVLMTSVYQVATALGASRARALVVSLIVLLPEALLDWDGGYQDMRRDASFFALLASTMLLALVQVWQPKLWRAAWLGVVAGLAIWSRGNALPVVVALGGPIVLAGPIAHWRSDARGAAIRCIFLATALFALVAGPNMYFTLGPNFARIADTGTAYGVGGSRWESLATYWHSPLVLWFGSAGRMWGALLRTALLVGLCLAVRQGTASGTSAIRFRRWALMAAGAWSTVLSLALICIVMGWRPAMGWIPFFPTLLLPMALLTIWLARPGAAPQHPRELMRRWGIAMGVAVAAVGIMTARMYSRADSRPIETATLAQAQQVLAMVNQTDGRSVVAFLSHDRINFDTLVYLESQLPEPIAQLEKLCWVLPNGNTVDTATTLPPSTDVPQMQQLYLEQIQERADYVVLDTDVRIYGQALDHGNFFMFEHGEKIVQSILDDARFAEVYQYNLPPFPHDRREYVVLRNLRRQPDVMQASTADSDSTSTTSGTRR